MRWLCLAVLMLTLTACTVTHHVREVQVDRVAGVMRVEKCQLKVYLAMYGVVSEEVCQWEAVR